MSGYGGGKHVDHLVDKNVYNIHKKVLDYLTTVGI